MSPANAPMRSSWEELYRAALVEHDREKLTGLLGAVESAIVRRRRELLMIVEQDPSNIDENDQECAAMLSAADEILKIKTEKLGWPAVRSRAGGHECPDVVERIRRVESVHHWHR